MAAAGGHALTLSRQIRNFGVCRSILQRSSCKNLGTQRFHLVRSFSQGAYRPISLTTSVKVGGITCAVIGTASFAWLLRKQQTLLADEGWKKHPVSRKVVHAGDTTGLRLTLYQYQSCPFCCKLRAFLDCHGFSYDVVEVNSVWRTQIKWSKYRKVPVLVVGVPGEKKELQLNDSSVIISILESYLEDPSQSIGKLLSFYPALESKEGRKTVYEFPNKYFIMYGEKEPSSTQKQLKKERQWRKWTDEVLVHMLSPNVYRTPSEALQAFRSFDVAGEWEKHFSTFERLTVIYLGSTVMYFLGKMLKRKYNLKDNVRQSFYDACQTWTVELGKAQPFLGGQQPNLADLSVYGALSSVEGCDAFQDVLRNTDISDWYNRMKTAVNTNSLSGRLPKA